MEDKATYEIPGKLLFDFLNDQDINSISYRQYKSNIKLFLEWLLQQKIEIKDFRTADFIKYKHHLIRIKQYSELTTASHLITVRLFCRWLEQHGYTNDVTKTIKIRKRYKSFKRKSLTSDQIKKFLDQFETKTLHGKRDFAIANLMLRNGLRESEVVKMNIGDITEFLGFRSILIQRKNKNEKDYCLPLAAKADEAIKDYLKSRNDNFTDNDPLFVSLAVNTRLNRLSTAYISQMIKKKFIAANITGKYYTAHSLRHTLANYLLEKGFSEYQVQIFMGHENYSTTLMYTHQRKKNQISQIKVLFT